MVHTCEVTWKAANDVHEAHMIDGLHVLNQDFLYFGTCVHLSVFLQVLRSGSFARVVELLKGRRSQPVFQTGCGLAPTYRV
jgi:hypothetical protein